MIKSVRHWIGFMSNEKQHPQAAAGAVSVVLAGNSNVTAVDGEPVPLSLVTETAAQSNSYVAPLHIGRKGPAEWPVKGLH